MKRFFTILLAGFTCFSFAQAAITVNVSDVGSDLVMETAGGSLNLSDLTFSSSDSSFGAGIIPAAEALWAGGTAGSTNSTDLHSGTVTYAGSSLSGSSFTGADTVSEAGDFFGAAAGAFDTVYVPVGYASGDTISASTITFNNNSISDFGWSIGDSGTWSWGSGPNADSITLTAVPEPSQYALIVGVALLGICVARRRLSRKHSA